MGFLKVEIYFEKKVIEKLNWDYSDINYLIV